MRKRLACDQGARDRSRKSAARGFGAARGPEWRRLQPGDDPVVDGFVDRQFAELENRLRAASEWHYRPRRYRLRPDVMAAGKVALYTVDSVALERVDRLVPAAGLRQVLAIIFSLLAYAVLVLPALGAFR